VAASKAKVLKPTGRQWAIDQLITTERYHMFLSSSLLIAAGRLRCECLFVRSKWWKHNRAVV